MYLSPDLEVSSGSGSPPPLEAMTAHQDPAPDHPPSEHAAAPVEEDTTPAASSPAKGADHDPIELLARHLKGKSREWNAVTDKKGPKNLLDLPVDILKEIIQHLPHTNDLTSLALCHSALHSLAIPQIYHRFDIVWPEMRDDTSTRTGVDALTYGLATLVMAEEVFGELPQNRYRRHFDAQSTASYASTSSLPFSTSPSPELLYPLMPRRRGNHYAQHTKKFSLGNGPADWVQEYLITKEGGKMLGTLVALAVARMRNLETFVWDMPTGVLRDVWLALSSHADRNDGYGCRLERVWIRWHDNSHTDPPPPPPNHLSNVPPPPNAPNHSGAGGLAQAPIVVPVHQSTIPAIDRVEHPTFSILPPLKSLSVLDIDELPYLDEMAILIGRSCKELRELRVGIAEHAQQRDWVTAWNGDGIDQVDYSTTSTAASRIGDRRLQGVLGVLVGRFYSIRQNESAMEKPLASREGTERGSSQDVVLPRNENIHPEREPEDGESTPQPPQNQPNGGGLDPPAESNALESHGALPPTPPHIFIAGSIPGTPALFALPKPPAKPSKSPPRHAKRAHRAVLSGKLKLEVLELERVPLSVSVLMKAFDWTVLTTLTLLDCPNHEQLWKALRRTYSPMPSRSLYSGPSSSPMSSKASRSAQLSRSDYRINLRKIHTNTVSASLIHFLRETLAPNTLEVLFLQEGRLHSSNVTVESIFRGPLRRHRASLKKLMIDSSERQLGDDVVTQNNRWQKWKLERDALSFITSGAMGALRELAVTIDYHDWHFFLQRLPHIPHLRSLYIPHIADHPHGSNIHPSELALQIVDIVTLRPEVELCYMGILTKCYEILENKPQSYDMHHDNAFNPGDAGLPGYVVNAADILTDDEDDDEDEDEDDIDGLGGDDDSDTDTSDEPHDSDDDDESFMHEDNRGPKLRLREILFYEDKVAIFKARHGRL